MLDFKPPKDNPLVIALVKACWPLMLTLRMPGTRIQVVGDGIERFRKLAGSRAVLCPNHAYNNDCDVMFAFARLVGEDFNFLAAREVFDYNFGWNGFWLQRLGVYSVVRGAADRESFKTTRHIIASGRKKLVIFPEGEISRQNDTLMPLESGVAQMCFWALDEIKKAGRADEPVYLVPVAIKYTYPEDIRDELEHALYRLESYLDIASNLTDPLYMRLRKVAERILAVIEEEYGQRPDPSSSINERIDSLREQILRNMADSLKLTLPEKDSQLDWVRLLRNTLDDYIYAEAEDSSPYQRKIHSQKAAKIKSFYGDLDRVVNFIAIYDGYLAEHMTQERFSDVLTRLELEVFGKAEPRAGRLVLLKVGEPIDLALDYEKYKQKKRQTIEAVNVAMESQIEGMLNELEKERSPVFMK